MNKIIISVLFTSLYIGHVKADCLLKGVQFLETGSLTMAITVADFNLDGYADVAMAGKETGIVRVFENQKDGSFLIESEKHLKNSPKHIQSGDFNGDSFPDLAVATSSTITILLNNGDNKFGIANRVAVSSPLTIIAEDFNHDSRADLAVLVKNEQDQGSITIFQNTNGSFRKSQNLITKSPTEMIAARIGTGNQVDLVVSSSRGSITVFKGSASGIFKESTTTTAISGASHLKAGLINNDQLIDLVVAGNNGDITVLIGINENEFKRIQLHTPLEILGMVLADFNNDNNNDLMFVNRNSRALLYTGNSHGSFSFKRAFSFGFFTGPILTADFNADQNMDFLATDVGSSGIYFGNGKNNFAIGTRTVLKRGGNPYAGDFDGDGNADLIISNSNDSVLLRGKGNGTFFPPIRTIMPGLSQAVVSDLNNDGRDDIAGFDGFILKVWLSTGSSQFKETAALNLQIDPTVQALDLNQDGLKDLAIVVPRGGGVRIFLNQGEGKFVRAQTSGASFEHRGTLVDINGDRIFDLAGIRDNRDRTRLTIYLGSSKFVFTEHTEYEWDGCAGNISAGDANGDSKADIAIGSSCDSSIRLFLGDGTGHLSQMKIPSGSIPFDPMFIDFNADEKSEVLTVARDPAKLSITVAPEFHDHFLFGPFYWNKIAVEDFDRDGHPDIAASSFDSTALFLNCE